VFVESEYLTFR